MNNSITNDLSALSKKTNLVFYTGSNYSLSLFKIIITHFEIKNYKVIFCGNNNNSFVKFYNFLKLNEENLIMIDGKLNYSYLDFYFKRKKIENLINKFIKLPNFQYFSSYNYGLVNHMILNLLNISKFYLLEDGITNYISYKNKYAFIKKIIYTFIFKKIVEFPTDWQNDKRIISTVRTINVTNNIEKFDFNKIFKNYIINNKIFINENKRNELNILLICAKIFHYSESIDKLINKIDKYFKKKYNSDEYKKFNIYIKFHPSDLYSANYILKKNYKILVNNFIPIEYYDLSFFDYILSPPNTSIINIKVHQLFNEKKIFFYDVKQHEINKKYMLMNKFKIKKIIF